MKFYTQVDRPKRYISNPGDEYLNVYQEEIQKDGKKGLICTGKRNIYAMIQEMRDETLMVNILKKLSVGDLSALRTEQPVYIDATTLPKNLMEAQNIVIKAKQEFEKMPQEVKDLFESSAEVYVSQMGTKEFLDKMAPYNKKMADIKAAGSAKEYEKKVAERAKFEMDVAAKKGATD